MSSSQEILAALSAKITALKTKGIEPKAILLSHDDYSTLTDEFRAGGGTGNPDRIRPSASSASCPLYSTDVSRISGRTGDIKEPMVIL